MPRGFDGLSLPEACSGVACEPGAGVEACSGVADRGLRDRGCRAAKARLREPRAAPQGLSRLLGGRCQRPALQRLPSCQGASHGARRRRRRRRLRSRSRIAKSVLFGVDPTMVPPTVSVEVRDLQCHRGTTRTRHWFVQQFVLRRRPAWLGRDRPASDIHVLREAAPAVPVRIDHLCAYLLTHVRTYGHVRTYVRAWVCAHARTTHHTRSYAPTVRIPCRTR